MKYYDEMILTTDTKDSNTIRGLKSMDTISLQNGSKILIITPVSEDGRFLGKYNNIDYIFRMELLTTVNVSYDEFELGAIE